MPTPVHLRPPPGASSRRGVVRRWLETLGLVGGHAAPHVVARMQAADDVSLVGTYLPGPSASSPAVLLAHGFGTHRRKPSYAYLADSLSRTCHVLSLDLRGHGRSAGFSTLGDREALDIEAGIRWLTQNGHEWIVLVGTSMGGTSAVHAAARGADAQALVLISTPARLQDRDSEAMRLLAKVWRTSWLRLGMRAFMGIRVVAPRQWRFPGDPEQLIESVKFPVLVVHGVDDHFFPIADAESLTSRAGGPTTLWREPQGFGHGEDGFTPGFVAALARAIDRAAREGVFPARDSVR